MSDAENVRLAAAWQAGFDAATVGLLIATNDAQKRGRAAALADTKPVPNPYRTSPGPTLGDSDGGTPSGPHMQAPEWPDAMRSDPVISPGQPGA